MSTIQRSPYLVPDTAASLADDIQWFRVTRTLTSGECAGNYIGIIEHYQGRYIALDGTGSQAGRFDTEEEARAALHPERVRQRQHELAVRNRRLSAVATVIGAVTSIGSACALFAVLPL